MNAGVTKKQVTTAICFFLGAVLFLTLGVWLAALTAVSIVALTEYIGGPVYAFVVEEGPDKIMRRCILVWLVVFLLVFLKWFGWKGWRDAGFSTDDPDWSWRPWWSAVLNGIIIGLVTIVSIAALTVVMGLHKFHVTEPGWPLLAAILGTFVAGILVALIEETMCRGILFRLFARLWSAWPAAILISLFFAAAHFMGPDLRAFEGDSIFQVTTNVFISSFVQIPKDADFTLWFINLTLLGIVLCAFVMQTKTIWLGVGVHAAWVWVIKCHALCTELNLAFPYNKWLGKRNDFMDSLVATIALLLMLAWVLVRFSRPGVLVKIGKLFWHVMPSESEDLRKWLNSYFKRGAVTGGRVLKNYGGCTVTAQAGLVLKTYRPGTGWKAVRFSVLPFRARRAFTLARKLNEAGHQTAQPVAWATERSRGLRRAEYLLMKEIEQAEPLTEWLSRNVGNPTAPRCQVMTAYGRLAAMFHRHGYSNRDLKHENVMSSSIEPWRLWVVDLDGVRRVFRVTRRRAARDLMRIGLSLKSLGWTQASDLGAFFTGYNAGLPNRLRRDNFPI